jgi:predicted O-methyltransferase YrrM
MVEKLYIMRDELYTNGLLDLIQYIQKDIDTKSLSMIEIGSYAGESTQMFANEFEMVIAIDPFMNDYDPNDITCSYMELEKVYNTFKEVVDRNNNIKHIRMTSDDAIDHLIGVEVDFIYIDGLHTYEQIKKDIYNYKQLIKPGGFIGGHDYHPNWSGIIKGVDEAFGKPDSTFKDTSWIKKLN